MRSVRDIPALTDVPVLVRTALNVPLEDGAVTNDYRLRKALPTIRFLSEHGARVILISHIGERGTETLRPVAEAMKIFLPRLAFCPTTIGKEARGAVRALAPGNVLILENLRRHTGEVGNDPVFAKELATLADVFVEDSFDTCHRIHASIVGVPTFLPSYGGLLLEEEVAALAGALMPVHPALAVIGGAKFTTKENVLETLLAIYDHVAVGGALANDFLVGQGHRIGKSLASGADTARITALLENPKLTLPLDVRVVPFAAVDAADALQRVRVTRVEDIAEDEVILDVGPATETLFARLAGEAESVLWNGPLGKYESGFRGATNALARAIASSQAHSVVGGGDTVASIESLGLMPRFSFVSTGGGAMLEFLAHGTLPGIAALEAGGL
ncbi:MAG: phosphoglycerate kinase [bacterium]|nr:phosphoglycerate kinase [bacterium]